VLFFVALWSLGDHNATKNGVGAPQSFSTIPMSFLLL